MNMAASDTQTNMRIARAIGFPLTRRASIWLAASRARLTWRLRRGKGGGTQLCLRLLLEIARFFQRRGTPMTVRILFGLAVLMSVVMLDMPPAAAMTLEQAMEWCSKRYGHLYDQN